MMIPEDSMDKLKNDFIGSKSLNITPKEMQYNLVKKNILSTVIEYVVEGINSCLFFTTGMRPTSHLPPADGYDDWNLARSIEYSSI